MKVIKTADFLRALKKLPGEIRELVSQQEDRFREDPTDSRLHLKKLQGKPYWSLRVTSRYRVLLYFIDETTAKWIDIDHRKDVYR
jgi:mRNA-degrading endonuclease RelE of RelBE toxin-antitoxin system